MSFEFIGFVVENNRFINFDPFSNAFIFTFFALIMYFICRIVTEKVFENENIESIKLLKVIKLTIFITFPISIVFTLFISFIKEYSFGKLLFYIIFITIAIVALRIIHYFNELHLNKLKKTLINESNINEINGFVKYILSYWKIHFSFFFFLFLIGIVISLIEKEFIFFYLIIVPFATLLITIIIDILYYFSYIKNKDK